MSNERKIADYQIRSVNSEADIEELKRLLGDEWQLWGSPFYNKSSYDSGVYQAIVKYE